MLPLISKVRKVSMLVMLVMACIDVVTVSAEGRLYRRVPSPSGMETDAFTVYDIKRTTDGFVWFATDRGLLRFDGEHTVRPDMLDQESGLVRIYALAPESDGSLIAATGRGVVRVKPLGERYETSRLLDGKVLPATCGLLSSNGISLLGSDEGLVAFLPGGQIRRITVGRDILDPSNNIVDMAEGKEGIYLLTKRGILALNTRDLSVSTLCEDPRLEHLGVSSIETAGGKIYVGTRGNGIWSLDTKGKGLAETFGFTKGNVVTALTASAEGRHLYVGTDGGGVTKIGLPSGKIKEYARHAANNPVSPRSNQIYSLMADVDERLWLGYYQNGADYTPSWTGPFELVDDPVIFDTRGVPVRALSISDRRITIGTREGITVFERNCSTAWSIRSPHLRSEMVISLLDYDGKTLIGTYGGGMQVLNHATGRLSDLPYEGPNSVFRSGHVFAIAKDNQGNIWIGTNEGLFMRSSDGKLRHFTSANSSLPEGNVYGIFFDSEGKGWICTEEGLSVYDPRQQRLRGDLFPSGFPNTSRYRSVGEDSRHNLYFIPETGMAFTSNLDLTEVRPFSHPLLDGADAKGMTEDAKGNVWLTTNRGIFRIDGEGRVIRFGLAAGLPSAAFLQGQPVNDGKGHIWFGNSAGLLRLTEGDVESSIRQLSPPVPTSLTINGINRNFYHDPEGNSITEIPLKNSSTVKLGFSTFSYAEEEPDTYLYSIDGEDWQRLADDMSVTLYELSPGRHELRVRSANDVAGSEEETLVRIRVPYPLWWYLVGMLMVIFAGSVAGIWGLFQYRKNKRQQEEAEKAVFAAETETSGASEADSATESKPKRKYASNMLSRNEAREIARKIEDLMQNEKPYLKPDLKVGDLAEAVGVSSHRLSQFFSQYRQQPFYDYVNSFRVEEFKRVARKDSGTLTLSAMAEQAGFSSRASFFRYFKNAEGISPGEWLKKLGETSE